MDKKEIEIICNYEDCYGKEVFSVNSNLYFNSKHALPVFVELNRDVQSKYLDNETVRESLMTIWGCKICKTLTYTNCVIERSVDYSRSKLISVN